jgi:hypothetical protein
MSRARDIANLINVAPSIYATDDEAVLKALVDAKGDLITGTADNAVGRLAVGTDGHLLSAASGEAAGMEWVAPPEGGLVHIETQDVSASSSIIFNDVFSATYGSYLFTASGSFSNNAASLTLRLRVGGTTNSSSEYDLMGFNLRSTGVISQFSGLFANFTGFTSMFDRNAISGSCILNNPFLTLPTTSTSGPSSHTSGGVRSILLATGTTTVTTSYDGCEFPVSAGTFTGKISCFGFKE